MIRKLLDYAFINQEGRITVKQYILELEEAEAEVDSGKGIKQEDVKKAMDKW